MKIAVLDISGKAPDYDYALCNAMFNTLGPEDSLHLFSVNVDDNTACCPVVHLLSFVDKKKQNSSSFVKRAVKALECFVNYVLLFFLVKLKCIDVLHFQWLPFLEVSNIESYFVRLLRIISPKTKLVLTIHNVYPHDSSDTKKKRYKHRFESVSKLFDRFIVHTETTKKDVGCEFGLDSGLISVVPHGVLFPKNFEVKNSDHFDLFKLIIYGNQNYYKGADILIDAMNLLPDDYKSKIQATVVGRMDGKFLSSLKEKTDGLNVSLIPEYVSDFKLYNLISSANAIVLPYRKISQSAVLLLALTFKRLIICSDLPSFKETLVGFSDDMFFESENPQSLANLLCKYLNNQIDMEQQMKAILTLNDVYSWDRIGLLTLDVYRSVGNV